MINGPVNLCRGQNIQNQVKNELTLTLILTTQDPSFNHLIYYINLIPAHYQVTGCTSF